MIKSSKRGPFFEVNYGYRQSCGTYTTGNSRIKKEYAFSNDAIKDGIFRLLEKHCTEVYYPLNNEKTRGFHVKRFVKARREDFVFINTANPVSEQIFGAAHELGHVWEVANKILKEMPGQSFTPDEENQDLEGRDRSRAKRDCCGVLQSQLIAGNNHHVLAKMIKFHYHQFQQEKNRTYAICSGDSFVTGHISLTMFYMCLQPDKIRMTR